MNEPTRLTECIKITAAFKDTQVIITTPTGIHAHAWTGMYWPWYSYPWVSSSNPLCPICGETPEQHDDANCIGAVQAYDSGPSYPRRQMSWTVAEPPEGQVFKFPPIDPLVFRRPMCGNQSMKIGDTAQFCWLDHGHPGEWHESSKGTRWTHGDLVRPQQAGKNAEAEWDEHCRTALDIVR